MNLSQIVSQDRPIAGLQRAFAAGRMPHAYLFCGEDGVGKFTTARAWAKMLLCKNRTQRSGTPAFADSCGVCASCKLFEGGTHPDFQRVYKELYEFTDKGKNAAPSVELRINVIREFLIDKILTRPQMSGHVVYVVEEFEKVNRNSQNAMLKVLEEPPPFCVIILLCSRQDSLLPTILSRCQLVRFGPVERGYIVKKLSEIGITEPESGYWASFCEGRLGQALAWAGLETKGDRPYLIKRELVDRLSAASLPDALEQAEWMGKAAKQIGDAWKAKLDNVSATDLTRRAQKGVLQMVTLALADALKLHTGKSGGLVNADQAVAIRRIVDKYEPEHLSLLIARLYTLCDWVDSSVNEKLIFEQLLLNLTHSDIITLSVS